MRLAGATRRQVSLIAAVESTAAATGGVAVGFGIFFLLRVPLSAIPFTGANVLVDQLDQSGTVGSERAAPPPAPILPATLTARLRGIDGVTGVVEVHTGTGLTVRVFGSTGPAGLVSRAQLASIPDLGRCPAGAQVAASRPLRWLDIIAVATNGSQPAVERTRTVLDNAYPVPGGPQTLGELNTEGKAVSNTYQQLADVVIMTSLAIASCTLATSIAAGLADRKRPFSVLRLTGARLATLRRVVVLESAVPLLAVAIVAIGVGFGAAAMFASSQMQYPLVGPGARYYLITARSASWHHWPSLPPRSRCYATPPARLFQLPVSMISSTRRAVTYAVTPRPDAHAT